MSKLSLLKSKIDAIADNLVKDKENNDKFLLKNKSNLENIQSNVNLITEKDNFCGMEEFKDSTQSKTLKNKYSEKYRCSICTKDTSVSEIHYEEKNIISSLICKVNFEEIEDLKNKYNNLYFVFYKYNNQNINQEYINSIKISAFHFIRIFLNENSELFMKIFFDSIEVNKFFLYQIYLFLSIIYLQDDKLNNCILLSYKTIIFYSSKCYVKIIELLNNLKTTTDNYKLNKSIILMNNIILSILKTLIKIPSQNQIMYYINPINNSEDKKSNRISGLRNLINLLKENKVLQENMKNIENLENEINRKIKEKRNNIVLPEMDKNKYKYSIIIELDETLVHYCEENDNYFVKVRYGGESFLEYVHKFCEIIILSTSSSEYSDIVIENINKKNNIIEHKIYSENYDSIDLSKINRDMDKTFIICHNNNFFNAPEKNIIKLKEFTGDENDKEFVELHKMFIKFEIDRGHKVQNLISKIKI